MPVGHFGDFVAVDWESVFDVVVGLEEDFDAGGDDGGGLGGVFVALFLGGVCEVDEVGLEE